MGYFDNEERDRSEALKIFYANEPISSQHVTKLILLQGLKKLGLVNYDPLGDLAFCTKINGYTDYGDFGGTERRWAEAWEDFNPEGVALLETLRRLEIYKIELRLLDRFERAALAKVARVVEADRVARNKYKRQWQKEQRKKQWTRRCIWRNQQRKKIEAEFMAKQKERVGEEPSEEAIERSQEQNREVLGEEPEPAVERPKAAKPPARPEVEVEIVRVGPNPRILQCKYKLLADEIKIYLWVKTNKNFVRGMKLKLAEQEGMDWKWEGKLPRFRGRW
jgi:hypothetical protein